MSNNIELIPQHSDHANELLKESILNYNINKHENFINTEAENETLFINECNKHNDETLKLLYQYYYHGGYTGLLFNMIKNTFIHLFIILFSLFLMTMIDWEHILICKNCNISDYLCNPYDHSTSFNIFSTCFGTFYVIKWLFDIFYDIRKYYKVQSVRYIFHEKLKLHDNL